MQPFWLQEVISPLFFVNLQMPDCDKVGEQLLLATI
jgi:hypothetical protein